MSFATKLGHFAVGVAAGVPQGIQLGMQRKRFQREGETFDAQKKQREVDRIQAMYDSGAVDEALKEAQAYPELLAKLQGSEKSGLLTKGTELGARVAGAETQFGAPPPATPEAINRNLEALRTTAGGLSAGALELGETAGRSPLGQQVALPQVQQATALSQRLLQKRDVQEDFLNRLSNVNLAAPPDQLHIQLEALREPYVAAGYAPETFEPWAISFKTKAGQDRDDRTITAFKLLDNAPNGKAIRDFVTKSGASPEVVNIGLLMAASLDLKEATDAAKVERMAGKDDKSTSVRLYLDTITQARETPDPEGARTLAKLAASFAADFNEELAQSILDYPDVWAYNDTKGQLTLKDVIKMDAMQLASLLPEEEKIPYGKDKVPQFSIEARKELYQKHFSGRPGATVEKPPGMTPEEYADKVDNAVLEAPRDPAKRAILIDASASMRNESAERKQAVYTILQQRGYRVGPDGSLQLPDPTAKFIPTPADTQGMDPETIAEIQTLANKWKMPFAQARARADSMKASSAQPQGAP